MTSIERHWSEIYQNKPMEKLGWYESVPTILMEKISKLPIEKGASVYIPGIGLSSIATILSQSGFDVEVSDISETAVSQFRETYPELKDKIQQHDITQSLNKSNSFDLWIDRAVLHFLLNQEQISAYLDNLNATVKPGGYAVFAEFSKSGAETCAGLPVKRYSSTELNELLSNSFELIYETEFTFTNPFGQERPYILCIFKKLGV